MSSQTPLALSMPKEQLVGPGECEAPGSHCRLVGDAHLGAPLQSPGPGRVGAGMRNTKRSPSSHLVAPGICMEMILTLVLNSAFSPHPSHSSLWLCLWPVPQQEPWVGLAGALLGHTREDAACLKLPEGHQKVRDEKRPNSTHSCCCLKLLLSWKMPAGSSCWNPVDKHGAWGGQMKWRWLRGVGFVCLAPWRGSEEAQGE